MIFALLGFVLSSLLAGLFLLFRVTGDVYPRSIKKFLYAQALKKWQGGLAGKIPVYNCVNPKTTPDTGIIVQPEDTALESPKNLQSPHDGDDVLFYGIDDQGNGVVIKITRFSEDVAEASLHLNFRGRLFKTTFTGTSPSQNAHEFSVGNLKLEIVEALRTWRLWFNGIMSEEDGGQLTHVTLNVLWKPLDSPTDSQKNANLSLISEQMASNGKFGQSLFDLENLLPNGYTQFGCFHGQINLDGHIDDEKDQQIYFYGFKIRQFLNFAPSTPQHNGHENEKLEVFVMCGSNGQAFRLSANNGIWAEGVTAHVSSKAFPAISVDALPQDFTAVETLPKCFSVTDENRAHRVEVWPQFKQNVLQNLEVTHLMLTINGEKSRGLLLRTLNTKNISESVQKKQSEKEGDRKEMEGVRRQLLQRRSEAQQEDFVSLEAPSCLSVKLVGGKGASLASLFKLLAAKDLGNEFKTAQGFCVTTSFFRRILNLTQFTNIFQEVSTDADLQEACTHVQSLILNCGKEDEIAQLVSVWMNRTFVECEGEKFSHLKAERFAVRSSGTLEDAADVSCAGQNDTFLGVKEENVARKIIECWASLFSSQSVRYRLNHGQPAVSDMGVVVQAMVNAKAAGVIFTADPITGNPFEMLVNANYGLGESVVSATCDPDTIKIVRSRDSENVLRIGSKTIGDKKSKIVVNDQGMGSTQEIELSEDEVKACCLPDQVALKLGKIALELLAANDDKPLDIEWAFDTDLYILQSRNITSLDSWTDFEIIHECDTPLRTQFERLTNANAGEVMPGATSTLSLCIVSKTIDMAISCIHARKTGAAPNPFIFSTCAIARQRLLINILQTVYRNNEKEIPPVALAIDLAIFGHGVMDEELHQLAIERWGVDTALKKLQNLINVVCLLRSGTGQVERVSKQYSDYVLSIDDVAHDPHALFSRITTAILDILKVSEAHCSVSEASSASQIFAFLFLSEGKKSQDWDTNLYNDVSKILSVCQDVESADIPSAMDKLAQLILDQGEEVVENVTTEKSPAEALSFIQNSPVLNQGLNDFMAKHGHRGIFELDLMRQSWKTEPLPFIRLLQSIVTSKSKFGDNWTSTAKSQFVNDAALLDSLQTNVKSFTRKILGFILPYCRSSVLNRERTKSLLVGVINQLKLAFNRLGELLVRELLISDPKLIYHLKHHEIQLLMERSPSSSRILYKAMRRQKLHSVLEKEEFNEIMIGIPQAIDDSVPVEVGESITATPVSSGKIQGTVKVCRSVEEASELIQPGDILVTHSTDIGWSPFFPILGGVVTELGGLISHGAVVAREYGLPCIVGATHATKIFKTGDTVILNASKGTLAKVQIAAGGAAPAPPTD